jgi:hypothetical protein
VDKVDRWTKRDAWTSRWRPAAGLRAVTELRQATANAEGRDKLDAQITAAETEKKALSAIAATDPGAD